MTKYLSVLFLFTLAASSHAVEPEWVSVTTDLLQREKTGFGGLCGLVVDHLSGDVWVNLSDRGMFHSADQGKRWKRVSDAQPKGRTETPGCWLLDPTGKSKRMVTALVYGRRFRSAAIGPPRASQLWPLLVPTRLWPKARHCLAARLKLRAFLRPRFASSLKRRIRRWIRCTVSCWIKTTEFSRKHGIHKIALEMHPGFVVYNPETLLKLRDAAGPEIGANFDPSHLIWQGIDPCAAVRALQGAIWHVHAKDTNVQKWNSLTNGVLDTKHYGDELNRSWLFRTVGYGSSRHFWCDFISALRMTGYDHALSIEHEDSLMTAREGLEKAIGFLQEIVLSEPKGDVTWA